ncbi:hypothetical protein HYFRA_00002443 [Hymenoscyphus fraxineus]|uniref:Uncharacterized protein n=1 Tax=Hymenoscyphus fraxineus TaxID=746836 RepID=A0A9N9PV34_9HELO|nr:hypothetical protein HYFRA_00002443 [Hymenoscyphus fraxineus]
MSFPLVLVYLEKNSLQRFLNSTAACIDSAYTTATNLAHLPNQPFGNVIINWALYFLATLVWAAIVIVVLTAYIVVPCVLLVVGVTWAFNYCIEGRLRTGDSWFTQENWGDDRRKLVGYENEKGDLRKVIVEGC